MDKFKEKSVVQATAWDTYVDCVCFDYKERSRDKHKLRKLSRIRLKRELTLELEEY